MLLILIGEFADEEMNQEVDDGNENGPATVSALFHSLLRLCLVQVDLEADNLGAGADDGHDSEKQVLKVKSNTKTDHAPLNHSLARSLLTILLLLIHLIEESLQGVVLRSGRPFRAVCG